MRLQLVNYWWEVAIVCASCGFASVPVALIVQQKAFSKLWYDITICLFGRNYLQK